MMKCNWRLAGYLCRSNSSLASAFYSESVPVPDKSNGQTGLFRCSGLAQGSVGYQKMTDTALKHTENLLDVAYKSRGRSNVVELLDEVSNTLCKVADLADCAQFICPEQKEDANEVHGRISSFVETLNTDVELYGLLQESVANRSMLDPETTRVAQLLLHDFQLSGIHLNANERDQVVKLNDEILDIGTNYLVGVNMPVAFEEKVVPRKYKDTVKPCVDLQGHVQLENTYPLSSDHELRRWAYLAFHYREPIQYKLIEGLTFKRYRLASLCGYQHYSDRCAQHSAIGNYQNVSSFLEKLSKLILPFSAAEFREMEVTKQKEEKTDQILMPYDVPYYTEKLKPALDQSYREYLSLGTCMEGINGILKKAFLVEMRVEDILEGETWHGSVRKIGVYDASSLELMGYVYCDLIERDGKSRQDSHFTIQCGKLLEDGTYQLPIVAIVCNFDRSEDPNIPMLLNLHQMETLFHEMGHAVHSMLARTRYQHVSGTRCVTDFAEVPSHLFEFFCRDENVLRSFARHYKTGQEIPPDMLADMQAYRKFGEAAEMQHQIHLSIFDHLINSDLGSSAFSSYFNNLGLEFYPNVAKLSNTAFYLRFGHLYSYGAKYYSYLYCKAIATKIWLDLFQADPFSTKAGAAYRDKLLRHGGARSPSSILEDLLGESPSIHSLAESLARGI